MSGKSTAGEDAGYFLLALLAIILSPFIAAYLAIRAVFHVIGANAGFFFLLFLFIVVLVVLYFVIFRRDRQ